MGRYYNLLPGVSFSYLVSRYVTLSLSLSLSTPLYTEARSYLFTCTAPSLLAVSQLLPFSIAYSATHRHNCTEQNVYSHVCHCYRTIITALTFSRPHWIVWSMLEGNDFSVQYGTCVSGGSLCELYDSDRCGTTTWKGRQEEDRGKEKI